MKLQKQLENYQPCNEQEEKDRALMLHYLSEPDIFTRNNECAHFTASAWMINPTRDKALMIYHNIYHSWAWTGGHADGEEDLLAVALREAREETGVEEIAPVSEELFSLEIIPVYGHIKNGKYVASHLHLNVSYLLQAPDTAALHCKPDENSGVRWFGLDEVMKASEEPWMCKWVYQKLNDKLARL